MSSRKKRAPIEIVQTAEEIAAGCERVFRYALRLLDNDGWTTRGRVLDRYGRHTNIFDETARKYSLYAALNYAVYETGFRHIWEPHFLMQEALGVMVTDANGVERWERAPERTFGQVERLLLRCIARLRTYQQPMEMAA
ncbi:MAG: hypothetical protein AB7J28_16785 [Hyphomonadaceae bacterium]